MEKEKEKDLSLLVLLCSYTHTLMHSYPLKKVYAELLALDVELAKPKEEDRPKTTLEKLRDMTKSRDGRRGQSRGSGSRGKSKGGNSSSNGVNGLELETGGKETVGGTGKSSFGGGGKNSIGGGGNKQSHNVSFSGAK